MKLTGTSSGLNLTKSMTAAMVALSLLVAGCGLKTAGQPQDAENSAHMASADGISTFSAFTLVAGQSFTAGSMQFKMQTDQNLVLYDASGSALWAASWSAGTSGQYIAGPTCTSCSAVFSSNGTLVLKDASGAVFWQMGSADSNTHLLQLTNSSPFVQVIVDTPPASPTNSSGYGPFTLAAGQSMTVGSMQLKMQTDQNLVLYDAGGSALWAASWTSGTNGQYIAGPTCTSCVAAFNGNGTLILKDASGNVFWQMGTPSSGDHLLQITSSSPFVQIVSGSTTSPAQPAPSPVGGSCGPSNGATLSSAPSSYLCSVGSASAVSGSGPWNWTCAGSNGGSNASCSAQLAPAPVNGSCGSANGVSVTSAPSSGLCSSGANSNVTGNGPWSWSCTGANGGSNASCSAPLTATPPAPGGSTPGYGPFTLAAGQSMTVGSMQLKMQTDQNLVLYDAGGSALWAASWTSGTNGQYIAGPTCTSCVAAFNGNGTLILKDASGNVFWQMGTPSSGDHLLQITSSSPFVQIVSGSTTSPAQPTTPPNQPGTINGAAFYVSPSGNDGSPGSASQPFQTLGRAQQAAQTSSTKVIVLRGGTYSASLQLRTADNGEAWVGFPGETAIIDAGGGDAFGLDQVTGMTFENLTIRNVHYGIYVNDYSTNVKIRWNSFQNCSNNCVIVNYRSGNVTIDSNSMTGGGTGAGDSRGLGTYHAAIYVNGGSSHSSITHNLIQNFGSAGISLAAGHADETNNNNLIDRNIVKNTNTILTDSGAIYTIDRAHQAVGNMITNNYIDGSGSYNNSTKCLYLDDEVSNLVVSGNVSRNCGQYGIQYHGGDHNSVVNNIFDLSSGAKLGLYQDDLDPGLGLPNYGMNSNLFQQNIVYFAGSAPNPIWDFDNNYGGSNISIAPLGDANNLYFSAAGASIPNGGQVTDSQPKYGNPLFSNAGGGNYAMSSSSAAFSLISFAALATDQGPIARPSALPQ